MLQNHTPSPRPAFVEVNPHLIGAHRLAQCAFFAAANAANLSRDRALQLRGINEALGLRAANRITSRRELSPVQMRALTVAIQAGLFEDDWTWNGDQPISIRTRTVQIEEAYFGPRFTA